jgi:hypothetical protein
MCFKISLKKKLFYFSRLLCYINIKNNFFKNKKYYFYIFLNQKYFKKYLCFPEVPALMIKKHSSKLEKRKWQVT